MSATTQQQDCVYPETGLNPVMILTRLLHAPIGLVWEAWTNPEMIQTWWGPKGFTNPLCKWNATTGGNILIHMKAPDGVIYPMDGTFVELTEPEKIVFISAALDANGESIFKIENMVTFQPQGNDTLLTLKASVFNAKPAAAQYLGGMEWAGT